MTAGWNQLPADAMILGIARCSEAEPQCTAVARRENGDIILANHVGAQLLIPAAEVAEVLKLAAQR